MTYGEKIAHLRKTNGMTQEDLGKVLNVTYQAVSKWERGESLPDFTTMSQIAKFFQVPLSYFEEDGEIALTQAQEQPPVNSVTVNYIGTCTVCGKMLKEGDEYTASPKIVCKSCAEIEEKKKQEEIEESERKIAVQKEIARREQLGTGWNAKLVVSLLFALASYVISTIFVFSVTDSESQIIYASSIIVGPMAIFAIVQAVFDLVNELRDTYIDEPEGYTRNLSLIIGGVFAFINIVLCLVFFFALDNDTYYLLMLGVGSVVTFTFVSQYMWGGVVKNIFTCGGFTFKLPGFIFSLTPDSIILMIITKIILGALAIAIFVATTVLLGFIAMLASVFTFIPCVIYKSVKDKNA